MGDHNHNNNIIDINYRHHQQHDDMQIQDLSHVIESIEHIKMEQYSSTTTTNNNSKQQQDKNDNKQHNNEKYYDFNEGHSLSQISSSKDCWEDFNTPTAFLFSDSDINNNTSNNNNKR